jgi:hypothetical protein
MVKDLLVTPDGWMIDPLLQSSLEMRDALCTTPKSHLFAKIIPPFPADGTLSTGNANLEGNSVSKRVAIDLRSNTNNYT